VVKFAVFTVSTPTYTPEEVVGKIKASGYDGVEWRVVDEEPNPRGNGFWHGNKSTLPFTGFAENAAAYKKLADDAGLEIPALGTYVACDELENVEILMKSAASIGVPQLRVRVPGYDNSLPYMPLFNAAREQYKQVAELAAKYQVKALIELHHKTILPSASAARLFVEGFDPAQVGVIHDAGNMVHEGFEAYRLGFEILGPFLAHIHIKNARWFPLKYAADRSLAWMADWAPVTQGSADIRSLLSSLHAVGYDKWITFEDFSTDKPLDQRLVENVDWVKTVWAEITGAPVEVAGTAPEA
jgi:sugar phosphate isomerase/epimerase